MSSRILPLQLLQINGVHVRAIHKKYGHGGLVSKIVNSDDLVTIATMEDALVILNLANTYWKFIKIVLIVSGILVLVSYLLSFWLLFGLIPLFIAGLVFKKKELECYIYLSSTLLGLEMLINDFAGLGKKYPTERTRAIAIYQHEHSRCTRWLDYYMPYRNEFSDEINQAVGEWLKNMTNTDDAKN